MATGGTQRGIPKMRKTMSDYNEKDKRFDDDLRELIAKGLVDLGHDGKDFAFRVTEKGYAVAVELEKQRPQENE